jgi:hypothetical protein
MSKTTKPFTEAEFVVFCHFVIVASEKYSKDPTQIVMFKYPTPAGINNIEIQTSEDGIDLTFGTKSKKITIQLPSMLEIESSRDCSIHTLVSEALVILKSYFNNEREFTDCIAKVEMNYSIWTIGERNQ